MEYRQYVNAVVESNSKALEKLMEVMLKQSVQMIALMLSMKNRTAGRGNLNAEKKQAMEEKVRKLEQGNKKMIACKGKSC